MTLEWGTVIAILGLAVSIAAFFLGRTSASKKEGLEQGKESTAFAKDIEYIKQTVSRIETNFNGEVSKLAGRQDELSAQLLGVSAVAEKALSSAKSAHHRLNDHQRNEHGKLVSDWRENMEE